MIKEDNGILEEECAPAAVMKLLVGICFTEGYFFCNPVRPSAVNNLYTSIHSPHDVNLKSPKHKPFMS